MAAAGLNIWRKREVWLGISAYLGRYNSMGGPANCSDGGRKGHSLLALADEGTYVLPASMAAKEQKYASMWIELSIDWRILSVVAIFMCPLPMHLHRPTVTETFWKANRADRQRTCSDLGMVIQACG